MLYKTRLPKVHSIVLLVSATALSVGCKSGPRMPGMNLFAWGSKPSPETLAGSGPSATFPVPPSQAATPSTIASAAAGVKPPSYSLGQPAATMASARKDSSPGASGATTNVNPATSVNPATTQSGGGFNTKSVGYTQPSIGRPGGGSPAPTYVPSGFTMPAKSADRPTRIGGASGQAASAYTMPNTSSGAGGGGGWPPAASASGAGGGFSLPPSMSPGTTQPGGTSASTYGLPPRSGSSGPGSASSAYSNGGATSAPSYSLPGTTASGTAAPGTSTASAAVGSPAAGYSPGSTSGQGGYPSSSYNAAAPGGGSMYR